MVYQGEIRKIISNNKVKGRSHKDVISRKIQCTLRSSINSFIDVFEIQEVCYLLDVNINNVPKSKNILVKSKIETQCMSKTRHKFGFYLPYLNYDRFLYISNLRLLRC